MPPRHDKIACRPEGPQPAGISDIRQALRKDATGAPNGRYFGSLRDRTDQTRFVLRPPRIGTCNKTGTRIYRHENLQYENLQADVAVGPAILATPSYASRRSHGN